jgi:hypothetical protein
VISEIAEALTSFVRQRTQERLWRKEVLATKELTS